MIIKSAFLLAAGKGRRAGGPKAWQTCEGRSLLQRQVDFLTRIFPPNTVIVSIQETWHEICRAIHPDVAWVPVDPQTSPLAALQELVRRAKPDGWAFLYHVDMPLWDTALFEALDLRLPEAEAAWAWAIVPTRGGHKGHPIALSPNAQDTLLSLDPAKDRLDHWLSERKVLTVEVPYDCILKNWNAPVG